jgi:hypothetical protein
VIVRADMRHLRSGLVGFRPPRAKANITFVLAAWMERILRQDTFGGNLAGELYNFGFISFFSFLAGGGRWILPLPNRNDVLTSWNACTRLPALRNRREPA